MKKKLLALTLASAMAVSLVGCGGASKRKQHHLQKKLLKQQQLLLQKKKQRQQERQVYQSRRWYLNMQS